MPGPAVRYRMCGRNHKVMPAILLVGTATQGPGPVLIDRLALFAQEVLPREVLRSFTAVASPEDAGGAQKEQHDDGDDRCCRTRRR